MADDDRIREFLKLRKQVKDDPKRIAAVIQKKMMSDGGQLCVLEV